MKREYVALLMSCVLAGSLGLFGCSSESSTENEGDESSGSQTVEASQAEESSEEEQAQESNSDYEVSIDGYVVTTDYEGNPAIVVTYTWTNNSDSATSFMVAIDAAAFQNGVELDSAYISSSSEVDYDSTASMKEVKSGSTQTVQEAYTLDDQSDVTIECTELFSFSDDILAEATFSVS